MTVQLPLPRSDGISNTSNNVSLECLASAAETKNKVGTRMALAVKTKNGIAKEQLMMQFFLTNPQSVALTNNISVNFDNDVKEEPEFGQLPDTQKLVGCLLDAAAATYDDEDNKDIYERRRRRRSARRNLL